METKDLSMEEKGKLLYEAMNETLYMEPCDDWKDRLLRAIQSLADRGEEADGDSIFWLVVLIKMFDRIKATGVFN